MKRQVSAFLIGTIASFSLASCGVFPRKTFKCESFEPATRNGTTNIFILDGYRIKQIGGSVGGASGMEYYSVNNDALSKDKGWESVQIKDGKINWKTRLDNIVEVSYELSPGVGRLKQDYVQLGSGPIPEDTEYNCKEISEKPEELVAELRRQQDALQAEVKAKKEEEIERKKDLAKWGPFFANSEVRQQAKKMCNDYAFKLTNQKQSSFYDDRTDFDTKVIGDKIWIGGPITVKVKDGNVDGSDFRFQKSVDCYWSRSATSLEGGQITVK